MRKTIAKIIIPIAIGIIVGEYFGNKNEIVRYYTPYYGPTIFGPGSKKAEINKDEFFKLEEGEQEECLKETHFNYRSFLTYSLTTSSILFILFFGGDLIKKKED